MAKVLGIGNALVDILTKLENDQLLEELRLPKGSMQLVDDQTSVHISQKSQHLEKEMASGGSAANTIHGLARLGMETSFIGTVGNDSTGQFFRDDLKTSNINPLLFFSETPSGIANAMISKDGERTFGTFLGAAIELAADHLKEEHFGGHNLIHIEGYLVQNHQLMEVIMKKAQSAGLKISLDLASYNVVQDNLDFLRGLVEKYVDIVFANEEEAKAFTGKNPEAAIDEMADMCDVAIVKIGKEGSMIKSGGHLVRIGVTEVKALDTTGAGDLYASGFLFGYLNDMGFEKAGKIGALLAGKVIEGYGAKISSSDWDYIRKRITEL
ncbi:MAG: adenosine kinase [Bacteroidales bacterium]|jgi:sugar/nucleoside kinase (ribokinase family)|nr:adenosine kinase [Bacteroidales bacterium]